MTNADTESPTTVWVFPHVTRIAYEALAEASMVWQDNWATTVGKALQLEEEVLEACRNGGAFGVLYKDAEPVTMPEYVGTGSVRASLKVGLTPRSLMALLASASNEDTEMDKFSIVLNQALQRWRDVVVAQTNGGRAWIQRSPDEPFAELKYQ